MHLRHTYSSQTHTTHNLCRQHLNYTRQHTDNKSTHTTIPLQDPWWIKSNNLILNSDRMTCTLCTPYPAEYNTRLQINNTTLDMHTHSKILCLTLDLNSLTTNTKSKTIPILKILPSTKWGRIQRDNYLSRKGLEIIADNNYGFTHSQFDIAITS